MVLVIPGAEFHVGLFLWTGSLPRSCGGGGTASPSRGAERVDPRTLIPLDPFTTRRAASSREGRALKLSRSASRARDDDDDEDDEDDFDVDEEDDEDDEEDDFDVDEEDDEEDDSDDEEDEDDEGGGEEGALVAPLTSLMFVRSHRSIPAALSATERPSTRRCAIAPHTALASCAIARNSPERSAHERANPPTH